MHLSYVIARRLLAAGWISLCAGLIYWGFCSASLDDFDSYNFARALTEFAPARFQPHPPGYVLYVWLGQIALAIAGDARLALVSLSVVSAALACGAAFLAVSALFSARAGLTVALLMAPTPLLWLNADKALSDAPALLAQAVCFAGIALAVTRRLPAWLPGLLLGISAGFRPQAVIGLGVACALAWLWLGLSVRRWLTALGAVAAGALTWLTPTLAAFNWNLDAMFGYFRGATAFVAGQESLFAAAVTPETVAVRWQAVWDWGSRALFGPLPDYARAALGAGALILALAGSLERRPGPAGDARRASVVLCWSWWIPQAALHGVFLNPELTRYALAMLIPAAVLIANGVDVAARRLWPARSKTVSLGVALLFAAVVGAQALPLADTLHTVPAPPDQLAAAIHLRFQPDNTLIVARQSYNALAYLLPEWDVRFADAYDPDVLARDMAGASAAYIIIADPEALTPGEAFVEIETLRFQRDPQVHAKHASVTANVYGRLSSLSVRDFALPPDGAIHIGAAQDGRFALAGWHRREEIGGVLARWMGADAEASLRVLLPPADLRLRLSVMSYPPEQSLTVLCEGEPLGQAAVAQTWGEAYFSVPAACARPDRPSIITLRPARRAAPSDSGQSSDRRSLSVAVRLVEFALR